MRTVQQMKGFVLDGKQRSACAMSGGDALTTLRSHCERVEAL